MRAFFDAYSVGCLVGAVVFYVLAQRLLRQARKLNRETRATARQTDETLRAIGDTQARVEEWTA